MKIDDSLQAIDLSLLNEDMIEEWTVDRDTAFEIGWNLTIINKIQNLFLKELNKTRKNEYRFTSIRFPITKETQELIYFPVYIIDYQYRNRQLQCLINGRTGQVAGLRQFSRLKVNSISSNKTLFLLILLTLGNGINAGNYLSSLCYIICIHSFLCFLCSYTTFCANSNYITDHGINFSFRINRCYTNRKICSRLFSSLSRKT